MRVLCSSYPSLSRKSSLVRSFCRDFQIVEVGDRISLGPKAHLAGTFEGVVTRLDFLEAVVIARNLVSRSLHAQFVPFSRRDLKIGSRELAAAAVDDVIEPVILLRSVGANDVVVVRILQTEDQSSCPVNASRHCLEPNAQIQVLKRSLIGDQQREAVIGLVG